MGTALAFDDRTRQSRRGNYQLITNRDGKQIACHRFAVDGPITQKESRFGKRATEAFYSAWIEELFGIPPEESLRFPSLAPVLRNSERNFLHNYLGLDEDNNLPLTPDCADLLYFASLFCLEDSL